MNENFYHHGDLKKEMMQKGVQLLNKEGYEGFSLRKLAAMCNVSHAAPYRHFKSKDELFQAINSEITTKFNEALVKDSDKYHDNPKIQMIEFCKNYISFMVENPDYFRYIFMSHHDLPIVFSSGDILFERRDHPFSVSKEYAKEYYCRLYGDEADWVSFILALWSQIQGLSLLLVNRTIEYKGDYLDFAHKMVESYLNSFENLNLIKS